MRQSRTDRKLCPDEADAIVTQCAYPKENVEPGGSHSCIAIVGGHWYPLGCSLGHDDRKRAKTLSGFRR